MNTKEELAAQVASLEADYQEQMLDAEEHAKAAAKHLAEGARIRHRLWDARRQLEKLSCP